MSLRPRRHVGVLAALGCLLVFSGVAHPLFLRSAEHTLVHKALEAGLLGGPGVGLLWIVYRVSRDDIHEDLYQTLTYWTFGTAALLLAVGFLLMFYFGGQYQTPDALFIYNFWLALGAFAGAFTGNHEARAVSQAREASANQAQRDRLEYLNHLLRHDLSNNLMVIRANSEHALEHPNEDATDRLETILRQSEQAIDHIQNVRTLVQASQKDQPLKPVDLTETIEEEVSHLRDTYPEATIGADVPETVFVRADSLLGSVFENLLRNAIQHNDAANPEVTIRTEVDAETVTVIVTDNGPGISPAIQETLFEPSEDSTNGFGLYLVDTLVDSYGGSVTIEDTGSDGTTIHVRLDRATADTRAE